MYIPSKLYKVYPLLIIIIIILDNNRKFSEMRGWLISNKQDSLYLKINA